MQIRLLIICCFFVQSIFGQTAPKVQKKAVPEIAEILIPVSAEIKNNFNLYYELHLQRKDKPSPSFWYKITFSKPTQFSFTVFPLIQSDRYDFNAFKASRNFNFCEEDLTDSLFFYSDLKVQKAYNDSDQSREFRSNIFSTRSIKIEQGQSVFIQVFNMWGNDCGHILDFQTSSSSFVVKVINDSCERSVSGSENLAQQTTRLDDFFREELCDRNRNLNASAIRFDNAGIVKVDHLNLKYDETVVRRRYAKINPRLVSHIPVNINAHEMFKYEEQALIHLSVSNKEEQVNKLQIDRILFQMLKEEKKALAAEKNSEASEIFMQIRKAGGEDKIILEQKWKEVKFEKERIAAEVKEADKKLKHINKKLQAFKKHQLVEDESNFDQDSFIKEAVVFRVQVGAFKTSVAPAHFKGMSPLYIIPTGDISKYFVGNFFDISAAVQAKEYIQSVGLKDAFIVAFRNGVKIPLDQAMQGQRINP